MNIVLIGYRCSGKTTVGINLARDMARGFIDTDRLIEERTSLSIRSYVLKNGWEQFRTLEKEIITGLADSDNLVIATGGGVVMDRDNVSSLRRNGWIVWLKTSASIIKGRMKGENASRKSRPALTGLDALEEIEQILTERAGFYARASDYVVNTNERDPHEVTRAIIEALPGSLRAIG